MDTILNMKTVFLSSICFHLLLNNVTWDNIFLLFMSGNCIGMFFGGNGACHCHNGCNFFMIQCGRYNSLLHASGHSQADKIEERNTFALRHARLYLAESDGRCMMHCCMMR